MLVVKVELSPGGAEHRARETGRLDVANVSNLAPVSDFVCAARDDRGYRAAALVKGHDRAAGMWSVLAREAGACADPEAGRTLPAGF